MQSGLLIRIGDLNCVDKYVNFLGNIKIVVIPVFGISLDTSGEKLYDTILGKLAIYWKIIYLSFKNEIYYESNESRQWRHSNDFLELTSAKSNLLNFCP